MRKFAYSTWIDTVDLQCTSPMMKGRDWQFASETQNSRRWHGKTNDRVTTTLKGWVNSKVRSMVGTWAMDFPSRVGDIRLLLFHQLYHHEHRALAVHSPAVWLVSRGWRFWFPLSLCVTASTCRALMARYSPRYLVCSLTYFSTYVYWSLNQTHWFSIYDLW